MSKLLTVEEAAEVLKVSPYRCYELIREHLLPAVHLGRSVRVHEEQLHGWIERGGQRFAGGWKKHG